LELLQGLLCHLTEEKLPMGDAEGFYSFRIIKGVLQVSQVCRHSLVRIVGEDLAKVSEFQSTGLQCVVESPTPFVGG